MAEVTDKQLQDAQVSMYTALGHVRHVWEAARIMVDGVNPDAAMVIPVPLAAALLAERDLIIEHVAHLVKMPEGDDISPSHVLEEEDIAQRTTSVYALAQWIEALRKVRQRSKSKH